MFCSWLHSKSHSEFVLMDYTSIGKAGRHSLKSQAKQTQNLLPFLEAVCSTVECRVVHVYFRNLLVIIHEMKIKGCFFPQAEEGKSK